MQQLQQLVRQLTVGQRLGIVGAAIASAVLLAGFVMWAGQPNYQPAFTKLSPSDAGAISDALRTAKIPFQLADAGATILVPSSQLSDAVVAAGAAGATTDSSTQGFSLFDKSGFGMSAFDQQVTYQRAIEGQLTQTIESMNGVASAKVAVVMAQTGAYSSQDQPASASVVLTMRDGQAPPSSLVQGIVSTVSGSVAGLTSDKVTVVDNQGRVLSGSDAASAEGLAAEQSVEAEMSGKVQALVDQALGVGHSTVAVTATVNQDKVEQQITTYTPVSTGNYTPVSVNRITESYGAGASPGAASGIAGSGSNVPGLPTYPGNLPAASASPSPSGSPSPSASATASASTSATSGSGYTHSEETVNYDLSQTISHVTKAPGVVEKLSVAVLIDQKALGKVTPDALKASIAAAIGADTTRGDVVSVTAVPFAAAATSASTSAGATSGIVATASSMAGTVVAILVGLVLLFLVWRNMRALRGRVDEVAAIDAGPAGAPLLAAHAGAVDAASAAMAYAQAPVDSSPQTQIQERLRMVANEKPDALVGLMHGWLREEAPRR